MKRQAKILASLLITALMLAASVLSAQQVFKATSKSVIGFYQYLPKDYASNSNKYPVVIFLHGVGERGPNTTNLTTLESAIWSVAKNGPAKQVKAGAQFPFILITPQLKNNYGTWPSWYVMEVIDYVKTYLRIDEKRIHITGFSLGGGGVWVAAQDFPKVFASASPICGGYNSPSKAGGIAAEDLPVWAFHGDKDATVGISKTANMVNAINSYNPSPRAKFTIYAGVGHYCWERSYMPDHTYHNPNLYEWIMAQTNKKTGANYIPTSNAGTDISKSSGTSVTLSGGGTDTDGTIKTYKWHRLTGATTTISSPYAKSTTVTGLKAGTYVYCLEVTDDDGSTDCDYVKVVIGSGSTSTPTGGTSTPSGTNSAPVANAGANKSTSSTGITITGSGSDSDGTIAGYKWRQLSGPGAASFSSTTAPSFTASALKPGTYIFRLVVTDNDGASDFDDVNVVVN